MKSLWKRIRRMSWKQITFAVIGALVLFVILFLLVHHKQTPTTLVAVQRGSITETVSVTGNTTPLSSVQLGFGASGNIARTYSAVGKSVRKGALLASLNTADIDAQIAQAQANLTQVLAQNSNTTVNVDQVRTEQDTLVKNAYTRMLSDGLVAVPDSSTYAAQAPVISGRYTGQEGTYRIVIRHGDQSSSDDHLLYTFDVERTEPIDIEKTGTTALGTKGLNISFPSPLDLYDDTIWYVTIPNTTGASYPADYNAYQAALNARTSAIAQAEEQLANTTGTTIAQTQVDNARAALASAQARRLNSQIISPIDGVITVFDAKAGEFASPGAALVSIISQGAFEVDAQVSETDVGKVTAGDKVTMTLDAFPGETFTGSVFYVDPAQTTTDGVVGYKIKVTFDKPDDRLKSGLTANIDIETRKHEDVLYLPQYAILQNDDGSFVQKMENGKVKEVAVKLGLSDVEGNVEILTGVTEGEEVLNIGLKTK